MTNWCIWGTLQHKSPEQRAGRRTATVKRRGQQSASLETWGGNTHIFHRAVQEANVKYYVSTNTVIEKEHFHIIGKIQNRGLSTIFF